jgi:hypothetical protein
MKNAKCNLFITSSLLLSICFAFATRIMYYIIGPLEPGVEGGRVSSRILEAMGAKPFTGNYTLFVFAHPP